MRYSNINLDTISNEDLLKIGDLLGYIPRVAKRKARRFIIGLQGNLKNKCYEETINFGDMSKVIPIFEILNKYIEK